MALISPTRRRAALSGVLAVAVAALAGLAAYDAARGGGGDEAPDVEGAALHGPDVPPPGALAGLLVVAGADCRLQLVDLARLTAGRPGAPSGCRLFAPPAGGVAVAARPAGDGGRPRELWLVRLSDPPALERRLGSALSRPSFSADGRLVAWCEPAGGSVLLDLETGARRRLRGCHPRIGRDGAVLTRDGAGRTRTILRDGRPLLGDPQARAAFPGAGGAVRIVGHGAGPDGAVVVAAIRLSGGPRHEVALELWQGRAGVRSFPIGSYGPAAGFFGLQVDVAPGGGEALVLSPEAAVSPRPDDLVALVDLRSGRVAAHLAQLPYNGAAWSPDGRWLAFSTGRQILLYGPGRTDPVFALPLEARALAWVPG